MRRRPVILASMAAGFAWAVALVWGARGIDVGFLPINVALIAAFTPPGLVLLALIARRAQRRFFDDTLTDGQDFAPGSGAWIDQKALTSTVEQLVLALCLWPFVALTLGGVVAIALGANLALMSVLFWVGCHLSPTLRGFGFAASFAATVVGTLWALVVWAA